MTNSLSIQHSLPGTAAANAVLAAGTVPIFKVPTGALGGGINVRECQMGVLSGTVTIRVVDLGTSGTAVAGTIASLVKASANNAPVTGTPNQYYLSAGKYIGLEYGAGTVVLPGGINILAAFGRGTA